MAKNDKDDKKKQKGHEDVVDLAARIGARQSQPEPTPAVPPDDTPPPTPTRSESAPMMSPDALRPLGSSDTRSPSGCSLLCPLPRV